jgi:hypothetical protein
VKVSVGVSSHRYLKVRIEYYILVGRRKVETVIAGEGKKRDGMIPRFQKVEWEKDEAFCIK